MSVRTRLNAAVTATLVAGGLTLLAGSPASAQDVTTVGCLDGLAAVSPAVRAGAVPAPGSIAGYTIIAGTTGNDVLVGTGGADLIIGLGGVDIISGSGGNDVIIAGAGNDAVSGGQGRDCIEGNDGDDILWGNEDVDTIYGDLGSDIVYGNKGDDRLFGYDAVSPEPFIGEVRPTNTLDGGEGMDTCTTGQYMDTYNWVSCEGIWLHY